MKKLLVLLMVLGLAIFWMPKSFADAPPDFNPPSGGPTIQEELQQVKELAAERIKEAKSLQIRQKAEKILKERGYYNNSWEGESWIFSDYSPGSKLLIERSKYRRGDETLTIEYNGELVFRFCYSNSIFTRGVIQVYRPGLFKWIAKLDEIFDGLDEVKAKGEIKDLKNRFGI